MVTDEKFIEFCGNSIEVLNKCKNLKLEFEPLIPTIDYTGHPVNQNKELDDKLNEMEETFKADLAFVKILKLSHDDIALRTALKVIVQNNKIDITNDSYRNRLTFEIMTIQRNGVVKLIDYFMLLEDVTRFVRDNGHFRGFGRGSGAGCILAYTLDITDVDPLRWDLLFERFLTKDRIGEMHFAIAEVPKK
jgi:DNA polymerase III alpha subunit